MARFYTNTSPIGNIVEGFTEGKKLRDDELYRNAMKDLAYDKEVQQAEEYARDKLGGFQKPKLNSRGLPAGFESNQPNVDQAVKRYPDAYLNKPIPGTPAMPDPAVKAEENASTQRIKQQAIEDAKRMGEPIDHFMEPPSPGAPADAPEPQAQDIGASQPLAQALQPQPLLRRKEEARPKFSGKPGVSDQSAEGNSFSGGTTDAIPVGPGQYVKYRKKANVDFGDAVVPGNDLPEKIIPATPPVQDPTLPTLEQMAAIDRQRFSGQKDAAKNVSLGVLPPDTRVALGFPADYTGEVPESLLVKMLDNLKQKAINDVAPEVLDAADKARKNDGAPGSLVRIAEDKLKRRLNEAERKLIFDSANRGEISDRFGQNQGQQKQKFLTSYLASSRKAMRQEIRPILESYDAANTIFNLAGEPDSQGFRRAMQTMMAKAAGERGQLSNSDVAGSSGVEGFWEQWEQFKSSFSNQGWTDENKETFQRLAGAYMTAAKQKIQGEVENQIDSDSSILANYNVAPTEIRNALSVDALLEGRSKKFDIAPKTIGRTKDNPTGKKAPEKVDAAAWKSYTRKAFDVLNSQKLPPEVENQKRQQILDLYKKKTGQSYFSEPK